MKIYENQTVRKEVIEALVGRTRRSSDKWSVSRLVGCPRAAYWWKLGCEFKPEDPDSLALIFTRGKAHHEILEVYDIKEKYLFKDDITGHADMKGRRIVEIFTTTMSSKGATPDKFKVKVAQLKSYLVMECELAGDLMVFFLLGDYSRPIKPDLKVWSMFYEVDEINEHWKDILHRRDMLDKCVFERIPPEEMGEPYECVNCGYRYCCVEFLKLQYNKVVVDLLDAYKKGEVVL